MNTQDTLTAAKLAVRTARKAMEAGALAGLVGQPMLDLFNAHWEALKACAEARTALDGQARDWF